GRLGRPSGDDPTRDRCPSCLAGAAGPSAGTGMSPTWTQNRSQDTKSLSVLTFLSPPSRPAVEDRYRFGTLHAMAHMAGASPKCGRVPCGGPEPHSLPDSRYDESDASGTRSCLGTIEH